MLGFGFTIGTTRLPGAGGAFGLTNTTLPAITGTPEIGQALAVSNGSWTGAGTISYAYQWRRGGVSVAGATAASYLLVSADDLSTISCRVTATDDGGSVDADAVGVAVTYGAPSAFGGLADQDFTENTGVQTYGAGFDFTGSGLTFSLFSNPDPTNITINVANGLVSIDTDATGAILGAAIVVRANNSGGVADSGFSLSVSAPAGAAATAPASSATMGSVTYIFDATYQVGQTVDGVPFVVVPTGTLDITACTPAVTTETRGGTTNAAMNGLVKNGRCYNQTDVSHGFDGYADNGGYDAAKNQSLPLTLTPGDIVVKAVSRPQADIGDPRDGIIDEYAALWVVSGAPDVNAFCPPVFYSSTTRPALTCDVAALVAGFSAYAIAGEDAPSYAQIMARFDQFTPACGMTAEQSINNEGYEVMTVRDFGCSSNYGNNQARTMDVAFLAMISGGFSTTEKQAIATRLIQHGIQWHLSYVDANQTLIPNGGHHNFRMPAATFALNALGLTTDFANIMSDVPGNYQSAFTFSAAQIADVTTPHSVTSKPGTSRLRSCSTVSGLVLTLERATGDAYRNCFNGLTLIRQSDGASAAVVSAPNATGQIAVTIDAQPASPFLSTDTDLYLAPPWTISAGDVDWTLNGPADWPAYSPSVDATYRNLQSWTGQLVALTDMGIVPPGAQVCADYMELCNDSAAHPAAAPNDWAPMFDDFAVVGGSAKGWEAGFWANHWATVKAG